MTLSGKKEKGKKEERKKERFPANALVYNNSADISMQSVYSFRKNSVYGCAWGNSIASPEIAKRQKDEK